MICNKIRCQDRQHNQCGHGKSHSIYNVWIKIRSVFRVEPLSKSSCLCNEEHNCYVGTAYYKGRKNVRCISEFEYAIMKSLDRIKKTRKKYRKYGNLEEK